MKSAIHLAFAAAISCAALVSSAEVKADPARGAQLFQKRCTGCHALDRVKAAPPVRGIFGRAAGRDGLYPYSDSMKQARVVWDEQTLDRWLADPDGLIPGNDMTFRLESAAERADIIAYLKSLGGK
jgi:cytochrome c